MAVASNEGLGADLCMRREVGGRDKRGQNRRLDVELLAFTNSSECTVIHGARSCAESRPTVTGAMEHCIAKVSRFAGWAKMAKLPRATSVDGC